MQKKEKILVIGDIILDVQHYGQYVGKSLSSTQTPVGLEQTVEYTWGGAGFLVRNILTLGSRVSFITLIGTDDFAKKIQSFTHPKLKKLFVLVPQRPTVVKERFWLDKQKYLGWQHYTNKPLTKTVEKKILTLFLNELPKVTKVVVADYRHGLLSQPLAQRIVAACAQAGIPLYIDSQVAHSSANHLWYKGASLFCINQKEALSIDPQFNPKQLRTSLQRLQKLLHTPTLVIKLGREGSGTLSGTTYTTTKAYPVATVDPSGAGDAFLACLTVGANPPTADNLRHASVWAALSTTRPGTEVPSLLAYRKIAAKNTK